MTLIRLTFNKMYLNQQPLLLWAKEQKSENKLLANIFFLRLQPKLHHQLIRKSQFLQKRGFKRIETLITNFTSIANSKPTVAFLQKHTRLNTTGVENQNTKENIYANFAWQTLIRLLVVQKASWKLQKKHWIISRKLRCQFK